MNFYAINRGLFKELHKYFSYKSVVYSNRRSLNDRIRKLKPDSLKKSQIKEAKKFYASYGFKNINIHSHQIITHISGIFKKEYLPEDLFHSTIEPTLNNYSLAKGLTDKNYLTKIFLGIKHPEGVIKNINGVFFNNKGILITKEEAITNCSKFNKLIVKPSIDSYGGRNIIVLNLNGKSSQYKNHSIKEVFDSYQKDFIIQIFLSQNKKMKSLNPTSINTIRIISLLWENKVNILHAIVRLGRKNSYVDNTGQGGLFCQIKSDGNLVNKGYDGESNMFLETDTNIKFKDFKVPFYDRLKEEVYELHKQVPHFRLVSWDLALDNENKTVLIEYNVVGQGVDGYEYTNGPFFGEFTNKVLRYCSQKGQNI